MIIPALLTPRQFVVLSDESSHIGSREYFLFGAAIIEQTDLPLVESEIVRILERWQVFGELKWAKVSRAKVGLYKDVVEYFWNRKSVVEFNALVAPRRLLHVSKRAQEGVLESIQVELFRRIVCRHMHSIDRCAIFVDERQSLPSLAAMRAACNDELRSNWGYDGKTIRSLQSLDSHDSRLMQIVDIYMGAIAYHLNGSAQESGASPTKAELSRTVIDLIGLGESIDLGESESARSLIWRME